MKSAILSEQKVQSHYDEIADVYDQRYDHRDRGKQYYDHIAQAVLDQIETGGELLDIGCGTGLFIRRYLKYGGHVTGIDISSGMIKRAIHLFSSVDFLVGNAEYLPFSDNSFDSISSLLAFSYLTKPEKTLKDCLRVLKPGGRIAVCTLGRNVFTSSLPAFFIIGEKMRIRRVGVGKFTEHYYSAQEMEEIFIAAGYTNISISRCSFAHFTLADPIFSLAKRVEPFIEEKIPYLAYNLIASGQKPE
ncbi:MAG: methyltransferase domain-containing protein [Methanospirillum sp.]|uniref:class I SAM-dependent methyltransferase n=1 Tax=Methanospirillum sp. TaxID=45200 RepID=UPI002373A90A|nr:class I SAM-dependent methyltransferase [Methanospirillum sp.]MDD1729184.1 methyltransferase domain-containing protein [Methanospirillum sp.]